MHTLSSLTDTAGLWISVAIVGSAAILLMLPLRKQPPSDVQSLGISTRLSLYSLLGTSLLP